MTLGVVAMAGLFTFRLAYFLVFDEGPFALMLRFRLMTGGTELGKIVSCPYCAGVWAALLAAALSTWSTPVGDFVLLWGAIAGLQTFLQVVTDLTLAPDDEDLLPEGETW